MGRLCSVKIHGEYDLFGIRNTGKYVGVAVRTGHVAMWTRLTGVYAGPASVISPHLLQNFSQFLDEILYLFL
jgi:hypothetical protein